MRLVVCDTGPLLHLTEIDRLDLLIIAGQVLIPPAVVREMDVHVPDWGVRKPDWVRVTALEMDPADQASAWHSTGILHSGEAESIALARQANCDWYLTDDAAARLFASSLGIEVHGTLGVVLWAAVTGVVDKPETAALLDRLVTKSSLWVSPRVLAEAVSALDELCSG